MYVYLVHDTYYIGIHVVGYSRTPLTIQDKLISTDLSDIRVVSCGRDAS